MGGRHGDGRGLGPGPSAIGHPAERGARRLADYAVATHNPFVWAATFGLQSLGNILLVGVPAE